MRGTCGPTERRSRCTVATRPDRQTTARRITGPPEARGPSLSYQVKRCDPVSLGIKTSRGSPPDEIGERPRLAGRNRERAKRIPASAPTGCSQISTSLLLDGQGAIL